ncbi:2-succinyl-6-hydroxy-2,4-cyclohexadiene-1-carboxylate synthase [Lactococcus garvieae]|uniref:2-succinyl-6-hydroxy-2, 4-cyclohexadiene-1-carboxylate synthase n=1 Tax=Lactococcus garvieae TaxID=1363 RepID=UPI0018D6F878|nr:2-succinyl-6-hydroxy-2,4-cyclohexadiene-1-carboxylate synthase [Lactococcus garvieae]QPS70205.1 2-succinyl-6-hydroxy-2,4-cyclohexadiene-1-carboxylate synthase [Lactococcus garvieae]
MIFEDRYIQIGAHHFHVRVHGEGKPLLALHGFSQSALTWESLDITGYQIFALDLIGHGESSKPEALDNYSLSSICQQLQELVALLFHGKSYTLLGYSMGGRIALQFAHLFPEQPIDELILESAAPGISDPVQREKRQQSDSQLAAQIEKNGARWFADYWGSLPIFESQKQLPQKLQDKVWSSRALNNPHALAHTLRATGQGSLPDISEALQTLKFPLLYITGALDEKYSQIARSFMTRQNTQCLIVEGAGHNVHLELPEHFNLILTTHLQGKTML